MTLLSLLFRRNEKALDQLAQEIARRCHSQVQQHLSTSLNTMTPNEIRGYLRSRAAMFIRREASSALSRHGMLNQGALQSLIQRATEYVVPMVARQLSIASSGDPVRKAG